MFSSLQALAWKEFHGGDLIKVQWNMIAAGVMADADKVPTLRKYSFMFVDTYFKVKVITTQDDLKIDGIEKVALFEIDHKEGVKTLYVNIDRWQKLGELEKEYLVIHELLNMSGLIDDDYHYSQEIFSKLKEARPLIEKYNSLLNYVYVGFESCQIENYRSVIHLIVEKKSLQSLVEYVEGNPHLCGIVQALSKRVRKILDEVNDEQ